MEIAVSAVTGELVSRFISFLMNKYSSHVRLEEKVERLQHLLTRVHTVVEEADGRYITNSGMLTQLKAFSEAMYRGYRVLDTFKHRLTEDNAMDEVSDPSNFPCAVPVKRPHTIVSSSRKYKTLFLELHSALESLEAAVANMTEFLVLLGGYERMSRKPYDAYLYIDSFMFGRHTEKQKLLNFLLQQNPPGAPAVLPIIGDLAVGKKTLVAHVCDDERVRSRFSSILHLNGDNFLGVLEHKRTMSEMMLIVVDLALDVDDEDWKTFYSFVTRVSKASKVIIVSKIQRLARFGSVRPVFLKMLSYEEFRYLFKILAFGSADPAEHPQLAQIAEELAKELRLGGSLVSANAFADVLRRNLNVQVWLSILNRCRKVVEKHLSVYGEHPKLLFKQGHQVDLTDFALHPAFPLFIIPCTRSSTTNVQVKKELPKVTFGELLVGHTDRPKEEFYLSSWESRIPPHTSFIHFVPSCAQGMPEGTPFSGRKRTRKVSI